MFERQTDVSLAEAIVRFEDGHTGMGGSCMWLNEIGIMAALGDAEAEAFLVKTLLKSTDAVTKKTAYSYLTDVVEKPLPATKEVIEQFEGNPANAELIAAVRDFISKREQY